MDKLPAHAHDISRQPKKDWAAVTIITCLILVAIGVVFGPVSSRFGSVAPPQDDQYADGLERISNSYKKCLERADSELPSPGSKVRDPMEGTALSEENLAVNAREDCTRSYNTQMRVLRNGR